MSKMNNHAARLDEASAAHPDDMDFDAPGPVLKTCRFAVRQRVRWGSVAAWVEVVGISKLGLRLVNGNFRWVHPDDVRPDGPAAADLFGDGRP
jgi:hypothetical protein